MSGQINSKPPAVFLNCAYTNSTNEEQELQFSIRRQENILPENPSNYNCYVSRWYLDSNSIPSFRITSDIQSDYYVGVVQKTTKKEYRLASISTLPVIDLYSEKEFIDLINLSIDRSYMYLLGNMTNQTTEVVFTANNVHTGYGEISGVPFSTYYQFSPTSTSGYSDTCNYVSINFTIEYPSTYKEFDYDVYLRNTYSGKQVLVTSCLSGPFSGTTFCDWAQYNLDDDSIDFTAKNVKPTEYFSTFKGDKLSGPWRLIIIPKTTPNETFNYAVHVLNFTFRAGQTKTTISQQPYFSPFITVNPSTNYLELNYTDAWRKSNYSLIVSPKIYSMLGYQASYITVANSIGETNTSVSGWNLMLPSGSFSAADPQNSWNVCTQPSNTFETFCDIEAILLTTSMNIVLEQDILAPRGGNKILASFIVDKYSATSYQFNMTGDNKRGFRLTQTDELNSFEMQFMIKRKNQINPAAKEEVLKLPPGGYSDVLLIFENF